MRCGNALIVWGGMTNGSPFVIRCPVLLSAAKSVIPASFAEIQTNVCYSPNGDEDHLAS
jgi:hypothetical protein